MLARLFRLGRSVCLERPPALELVKRRKTKTMRTALYAVLIGTAVLPFVAVVGCRGDSGAAEKAFQKGLEALHKGDSDLAVVCFTEAIRLMPDYVEAYYNRGIAYDDKGDREKAIADYDEAIRLQPDDADAL